MRFSILLYLLTKYCWAATSQPIVVGYLNLPIYGMQNKFIYNLMTSVSTSGQVSRTAVPVGQPKNLTFIFQSFT